jgi:arsenite oxidase small subunit
MGEEEASRPEKARRNFLKRALGVAAVLVIAGIAAVTKSLWTPGSSSGGSATASFPEVKVGTLSGLSVNSPVIFNYPLDNEPNILVKLGQKAAGGIGPDGDIVAFSIVCQHLGCVVGYQAPGTSPRCNSSFSSPGPVGYCCCHASVYDLLNGAKVIGGPSPRPQPQVKLQLDSSTGDIYAVGMGPPTVFGHSTGSSDVTADLQGGNLVS